MQAFILKFLVSTSDGVITQQTINSELVCTDEELMKNSNVAQGTKNNKQKIAPKGGKHKRQYLTDLNKQNNL